MMNKDQLTINTIRLLSAEAIQKASLAILACLWDLHQWHIPFGLK